MIVVHRRQLEAICRQRGYDLDAAMPCVISQDGDRWTIDEKHAAYPRYRAPQSAGPGAELKSLLRSIGIEATANCSCNAKAAEMDSRGCDWCEANLGTIVGWLREEAGKRKLPFLDFAGRLLVRRAIAIARRKIDKA